MHTFLHRTMPQASRTSRPPQAPQRPQPVKKAPLSVRHPASKRDHNHRRDSIPPFPATPPNSPTKGGVPTPPASAPHKTPAQRNPRKPSPQNTIHPTQQPHVGRGANPAGIGITHQRAEARQVMRVLFQPIQIARSLEAQAVLGRFAIEGGLEETLDPLVLQRLALEIGM